MDFKSYVEAKRGEIEARRADIEALRAQITTLEEECATLERAVKIAERDGVDLAPLSGSPRPAEKRSAVKKRSHHKKKTAKSKPTLVDSIRQVARELPSPFSTGDARARLDRSLYKNYTSLASTMRRLGDKGELIVVQKGGPGKEAMYRLPPSNQELFDQPRPEQRADEPVTNFGGASGR
jgi:hypothetical protein